MKKISLIVQSILVISTGFSQVKESQQKTEDNFVTTGQWANYGNDPGGMRYSPLSQINVQNVKNLKQAWVYQSGELKTYEGTNLGSKAAFEATPLMINGILYFSTPTNRVIAIDAANGKELWVYNTDVDLHGDYSEVACRGVSKWIDASLSPGSDEYMRIFVATIDGRLIALNAKS